jgi:drug/metabolite transporter (DMT)-like permease
MFTQLSNNSKAIILAIAGFSAFSVSDAAAKWLTLHYPPVQVIAFIAFFSFVTVIAISPFLGGLRKVPRTPRLPVHLARGLLNTIISLLIITSFSKLTLAMVYTLIFIAPFITTLLAIPFYKETVHKSGWIAICGGFLGVLIVLRPGFIDINPWMFLPLIGSFFISCLFLLARAVNKDDPLISLSLFPVAANLVLLGPFALWFYGMPLFEHIPVFLAGGAGVIAGLTCTAQAFRVGRTAVVAPFIYLQIIWAVILGYFIFGTQPNPWTLTGAGIIIASGIYLIESERRIAKLIRVA